MITGGHAQRLALKRPRPRGARASLAAPLRPGTLVVYTDGACLGNGTQGARAGVGVWFGPGDARNLAQRVAAAHRQTNQTAEVLAALAALRALARDTPVCVCTDSTYVVRAMNEWRHAWNRRGPAAWDKLKNRNVLRALSDAVDERTADTLFQYVPGHAGVPGNEEADALAQQGARLDH